MAPAYSQAASSKGSGKPLTWTTPWLLEKRLIGESHHHSCLSGVGAERSKMAEKSEDVIGQSVGLQSLNWMPLPEVATFSVDDGRSFVRSLEDGGGVRFQSRCEVTEEC